MLVFFKVKAADDNYATLATLLFHSESLAASPYSTFKDGVLGLLEFGKEKERER